MSKSHTLRGLFESTAAWHPDHEAFVPAPGDPGERYTYADADAVANRWAAGFESLGITKCDRIAFTTTTSVEYALAYFGAIKCGAIPAPLHGQESSDIVIQMLEQLDPAVVVFDPSLSDVASEVNERTGIERFVALDRDGQSPPRFAREGGQFRSSVPDTYDRPPLSSEDPAFVCFTSGSTGTSKGIVHRHSDAVECAHLGQYLFSGSAEDTLLHLFTP